jgi:hypothetical protein
MPNGFAHVLLKKRACSNRNGGKPNEAHSDHQQGKSEGIRTEGRLRQVPGILPVRLQDFLHSCKPEV